MPDLYVVGVQRVENSPFFESVRVFNGSFFDNQILTGQSGALPADAIVLRRWDLLSYLLSEDPAISFQAAWTTADGGWEKGDWVVVERVGATPCLKLRPDGELRDDLGPLAEF